MRTGMRGRAGRRAMVLAIPVVLASFAVGTGSVPAQVYGVALPDISNKTLSLRPTKVPAGGEVEIISAVQNRGAADMKPAYRPPPPIAEADGDPAPLAPLPPTLAISFVLVDNVKKTTGAAAGGWGVDALRQREIERRNAIWIVPPTTPPGTWYLCAIIDPENRVRESNEHNNRTCQRLIVEPAPEPVSDDFLTGENVSEAEDEPESGEEARTDPAFSGLDGASGEAEPQRP